MQNITDVGRKTIKPEDAIKYFFENFSPQQVAYLLEDCFNSNLDEDRDAEEYKFSHWILMELKELIEAIEPANLKRIRLQKELESIK